MSYRRGPVALLLLILATLALAPSPVSAEPAEHFLDQRLFAQCEEIVTTEGTLFLSLGLTHDDPGAGLSYTPVGGELPSFASANDGLPIEHTISGASVTARIPTVIPDPAGPSRPGGVAFVTATIDPTGPQVPFERAETEANRTLRFVGWTQPVVITGSVRLPDGVVVPFEGCAGTLAEVETFRTNPHTLVSGRRFSGTFCEIQADSGYVFLLVELNAPRDGRNSWIETVYVPVDPARMPLQGVAEVEPTSMVRADAAIPMSDPDGTPAGQARLRLALQSTGERGIYTQTAQKWLGRVTEEQLVPVGSLELPGGESVDLASCEATLIRFSRIFREPSDTGHRGQAAVNDRPADAVRVTSGTTIRNLWTGSTRIAREKDCFFEFGLGRTVWYRIAGTGSPVSVDTAGSDFDTQLVIYRRVAGSGLEPVDCVADMVEGRTVLALSLQARATFETEPGVTYYVQVGGYEDPHLETDQPEVGRLRLTVP